MLRVIDAWVIVTLPGADTAPPCAATLPTKVELVTVAVPPERSPPPLSVATLSDTVLESNVRVPRLSMPAPSRARLSVTSESRNVRLAPRRTATPPPLALLRRAPRMVTPSITTPVERTSTTRLPVERSTVAAIP